MMNRIILCLLCVAVVNPAFAREAIWIEGEDTFVDNFNDHVWYSASDLALDLLSPGTVGAAPGDWLTHFGQDAEAAPVEATYAFETTEEGPHAIWIRANYLFFGRIPCS